MLANRGPQIIERDWRPGFTIDLQQKDVSLVLQAADQLGVPVVVSSLVFNLYRTLQAGGLGAEGNHALRRDIQAFVRQRIAAYKYPRWVEFVPALPRTPTGKIQRFRLRADAPGADL